MLPGVLPPPIFKDVGSTPLSTLGGAPAGPAAAGPSEFTQMISRAPAPVVPAPAPSPNAITSTYKAIRRIPTALIVVINAVILIAVLLVVLVMRRPAPTVPKVPTLPAVPTAPTVPVLKDPTATPPAR